VSAKEDRDLAALLHLLALGIGGNGGVSGALAMACCHLSYDCYSGVGAFGAALLGAEEPAEVEAAFENAKQGPGGSLVSAKEERDLAALLDLFALGVGDVEEFQERLQAELAALEVRIASC